MTTVASASVQAETTRQCLLVEDDVDMRAMIAELLRGKHFEVTAVGGLVLAVKALAQQTFDLCLLDMHLPDGHGLQLIEHLRQRKTRVPVIVVTAYGDTPTAVQALKQGADNFIDKPVNTTLLYRAIDDALADAGSKATGVDFLTPVLTGSARPVQLLRRQCLQQRDGHMMAYVTGKPGAGHRFVVEFFRQRDEPGTLMTSSADLGENATLVEWRECLQPLLAPPALSQAAVGTVLIEDLNKVPADTWDLLNRVISRLHQSKTSERRPRLIVLNRTDEGQLLSALSGPAKKAATQVLSLLDPYHLPLPTLSERTGDGEALMQAIVKRHQPRDRKIMLIYTAKTQRWLDSFAQQNELSDLDDYLRQFLHAWPDDDSATGQFSVPDLSQQDFELFRALDRFRWNRTKAGEYLGLSLRQIRYRLSKIGRPTPPEVPE
ncbi:MAG: response regulator [Gammaproteobacteria bacterium]|nr:response regulator [Gammaproteobacteria bacterium]